MNTDTEMDEPTMGLPDYRGVAPIEMKVTLSGMGSRFSRPHSIGDRVVILIGARVTKAGHKQKEGLIYTETLVTDELFEIPGEQASRLLDEAAGRVSSFTAAVTDPGVKLTEEELADLSEDPVCSMLDDDATPVVVVYSDRAREHWPDDFGKGTPRPAAGEMFEVEDGTAVYVAALLSTVTGEELATFTKDAAAPSHEPDAKTEPFTTGGTGLDDFFEGVPDIDSDSPALSDIEQSDVIQMPVRGEPTAAHFAVIDQPVADAMAEINAVESAAEMQMLLEAERQGRGRGLKPRASMIKALDTRLAIVGVADDGS